MSAVDIPILLRPDDIRERVAGFIETGNPYYAPLGNTIRHEHGSVVRTIVDATIWAVAEHFLEILSFPWLPIQKVGAIPSRIASLHCPCCFAPLWMDEDPAPGAVGAHSTGCPWIVAARALGVA